MKNLEAAKEYIVEVTETKTITKTVEAKDAIDAKQKALNLYLEELKIYKQM